MALAWRVAALVLVLALAPLSLAWSEDSSNQVGDPDPRTDYDAFLDAQAQLYQDSFQFIDLHDLNDLRGQIRFQQDLAASCAAFVCEPLLDCPGASMTGSNLTQVAGELRILARALDHLHEFYVAHLFNLQNETLIAEETYLAEREVFFLQRTLFYLGAMTLQVALIFNDISALQGGISAGDGLEIINALDEIARDGLTAGAEWNRLRASSGGFSHSSDFDNYVTNLTTAKSSLDNLRGLVVASNQPGSAVIDVNALSIVARQLKNIAETELARRQAEIEALRQDLEGERRDVDEFLQRTHALAVESELLTALASAAETAREAIIACPYNYCFPPPLFEVDDRNLFVLDPRDGDDIRGRLSIPAVEAHTAEILKLTPMLTVNWLEQQSCPIELQTFTMPAPTPLPQLPIPSQNDTDYQVPPGACDLPAAIGICQALTPEFAAECGAPRAQLIERCEDMYRANNALFQEAQAIGPLTDPTVQAQCRAECAFMSEMDRFLEAQRRAALHQIAALDRVYRGSGEVESPQVTELETKLEQIAQAIAEIEARIAARAVHRYRNPQDGTIFEEGGERKPDDARRQHMATLPGEAREDEATELVYLREQQAETSLALEAQLELDEGSAWYQQAAEFWGLYSEKQMLTCGSEEDIAQRLASCQAECDPAYESGVLSHSFCAVPASAWTFDAGAQLYPPNDPRREDFPAFGSVASPQ